MLTDSDRDRVEATRSEAVEATRERLREHAEGIRKRELDEAMSKLSVRGELTTRQQEILVEMTVGITEGVLSSPETMLEESSQYNDNIVSTVRKLFDLEE